ncbi:Eco57I restriction-modification methylase domain-containing protein [Streptomyces avicenniae]|uniref:Eco57I restriction-modification methylase domain-containing protein n=1 Tax=Streptomyces avicenniae TaxID=500153 RepID=UPI00069A95FC|nr:Eco57I restriction-modification methylase domain-containing protein [Streptomyces avicenniae]
MSDRLRETEERRVVLQRELDSERTQAARNAWGQFATPPPLASEIMRYALSLHGGTRVDFLEPSCGSGALLSALLRHVGDRTIGRAVGVELDPRFAAVAADLWREHGVRIVEGDFTHAGTPTGAAASLLVANPPYVRHHHLSAEKKRALGSLCADQVGIKPSGLSGLYLYFVLLSHRLLAPGAVSAWLVPSEFMDVNYGVALKRYLSTEVELVRVHQYDAAETQFDDALVTSSVVVFRNSPPSPESAAAFSFGGTLSAPKVSRSVRNAELNPAEKWSRYLYAATSVAGPASSATGPRLSDFFTIRRGLATGSNAFFILPRGEAERIGIQERFLRPILPSPRKLTGDAVAADSSGWPDIPDQLALIDCSLSPEELVRENPELAAYLESADEKVRSGYLVSKRSPWYKQESRDAAPVLLTYMGRGKDDRRPLRFLRNDSDAVATNMYLMLYPTARLRHYLERGADGMRRVHEALLSLTAEEMRGGGRVYGGGLHKMEPRELAALPADSIAALAPELLADREQDGEQHGASAPGAATGVVRAWARARGMRVTDRGRLGPDVWDAWNRAQSEGTDGPRKADSGTQPALW